MFPIWLKQMKSNQTARLMRDGVIKKIAAANHVSDQKAKEAILPYVQELFRNNPRFACKMIRHLDLSESEVKFLLGEKYLHRMKDILQCAEKTDEKQEEIDMVPQIRTKNEEEKKETTDLKQPSIFDF